MVRGPEISATFAFVAGSERVEDAAKQNVPEGIETSGLSISSDVITGRNAISVVVKGGDPEAVHAMAVAVADETVRAVAELNDSFDLDPLDAPQPPREPIAPNKPLTIALGTILGLLAGIGLAILIEYLGEIGQPGQPFNIVDERLDVYNDRYFDLRFREEISRARHGNGGFSVGVLKVSIDGSERTPRSALAHAALLIRSSVRDEDLLAHLGEGTLGLLMPELPVEHAEAVMADWERKIAAQPLGLGDGTSTPLRTQVAVAEYDGRDEVSDPVAEQVSNLL